MGRLARFIRFFTEEDDSNGGDKGVLKTVTGTSLHIEDALAKPPKSFAANLEPVIIPGKNLFNKNDYVKNVGYIDPANDRYVVGAGRITAVLPDPIPVGTYTISRATSARLRAGLVTSTTLTNYQAVTNKVAGANDSDSPVTITVSQSGYYLAIFFKDTADADEQYLLDHLQVEVGSSATSYEDYTCTFTGHTGANVTRTGKNLLDPDKMTIYSGGYGRRWYENDGILLKGGQAYTFSVSGTSQTIRLYIVNKSPVEDLKTGSGTVTYTPPEDVLVYLQAYRAEVIQDENKFQLEFGSTASDYEEYKGVTTIPITFPVLGKNLLDMSDANIEVGKYIDNSGAEKTNGSNFYNTAYVPVKASTAYTLGTSSGIKYCSFMEYDENKTFIKRTLYGNGSTPFTTQSHTMGDTTAYVIIGSNPTGSTINLAAIKAINWMFNEGSTAQAYEPYNSTVYGGTLDVTKGILKAYPYYYSYNGEPLTGHWISSLDEYAEGKTPTTGAQVVNDGATPITYQLTPTEIDLLQGENNIWTDTDIELELKYYAEAE